MNSSEKIINQYQTRIDELDTQLQQLKTRSRWYSAVRLTVFAGVVLAVYAYVVNSYPLLWLLVAMTLVVLFFFMVNQHVAIKYKQSVLVNLIQINQNEISILRHQPSFLPDGNDFHEDFTYSSDLDIFGPRSLYHMINRCFSENGRRKLAHWLMRPDYDMTVILQRQEAIGSIVADIDRRQNILAHGLVHFQGDERPFNPGEVMMDRPTERKIKLFRWILPAITLISIATAIASQNNNIILYGFLLNLIFTGLFFKTTQKVLQRAEHNLKTLKNYKEPLKVLIQGDYKDEMLRGKKRALVEAYQQFNNLQKRYDLLESRTNPIAGLFLNGVMGFDFWVLTSLNNWYKSHVQKIPDWLDEIAWFEALFSLGTFAWNNPSYTVPLLNRETGITGSNIRHPFISDEDNIGNTLDFTLPLNVILLTGSNMSGKSTFLRSVGVNQVLALAGSVVAADEFHTGFYGILTSFRKADSIQEHTSLFYDELKKLQYIIKTLDEVERPQLILLDEILRGTNSDDKYFGSKQVLLQLKDKPAMTILATHDIDLARLEDDHGPSIQNYSFESQIKAGELHFDYKLHKGVAVNKNATFLMEKMGIIPVDISKPTTPTQNLGEFEDNL